MLNTADTISIVVVTTEKNILIVSERPRLWNVHLVSRNEPMYTRGAGIQLQDFRNRSTNRKRLFVSSNSGDISTQTNELKV